MNQEKMRICIAEACGFDADVESDYPHRPVWKKGYDSDGSSISFCECDLPDYLNDLNAMHEAEKILTPQQKSDILCWLYDNTINNFEVFHATASQRAEAFLRTIGKWKGGK